MRSFGIIIALTGGMIMPIPTAKAQHCEVVGCWRECRPVPGGRWCRNICRRRCWHPPPPRYQPPAYLPAPEYRAPQYVAPVQPWQPPPPYVPPVHQAAPQIDHGLLLLGGAAVLIMLIAVVASALRASETDTEHIDADIQRTNELTAELEAAVRDADRHIAAAIARARHGGSHG